MDITGYIGKKIDLVCKDGKTFSGYMIDFYYADDSDIGSDSIEIAPVDKMFTIEIAVDDIERVSVDENYKELDIRG